MSIQRLMEEQIAPQVCAVIKEKTQTDEFKKGIDAKVGEALRDLDVSDMVEEILYDNDAFYKIIAKEVKASLKRMAAAAK